MVHGVYKLFNLYSHLNHSRLTRVLYSPYDAPLLVSETSFCYTGSMHPNAGIYVYISIHMSYVYIYLNAGIVYIYLSYIYTYIQGSKPT